jgi:NADPH2:quinone reductase
MRAVTIARQGDPVASNVRVVDDWPDIAPGAGEVMVRTEASALNHLDLWVGLGIPGVDLQYPRISGSDGCGTVEAVGEGVSEAWIGRRVLLNAAMEEPEPVHPDVIPTLPVITMIGEHVNGTMAQHFTAPAHNVLDVGDTDPVKAAAAGLTFLTAWRMLATRAGLEPGTWVLVTGIGGGVALAALCIARYFGCRTIVTSRYQTKLDHALALGADHGILDDGKDFSRAVRSTTKRRGVDVCVDSIGKATHLACIKSLARGGTLVTCGCTSGADAVTDLSRIFWNQLSIIGSTMSDMTEFAEVVSLIRNGSLEPVVDSVHTATDGPAAYARLESGEQFGKIVVTW